MDRFNDNVSPDPSSMIAMGQCYKTPELTSHYSMHASDVNFAALFPTPPSDNDESNSSYLNETFNKPDHSGFTPITSNHHRHHYSQQMNESGGLDDEARPSKATGTQMAKSETALANSSRYRRRSRTTYSKSQVSNHSRQYSCRPEHRLNCSDAPIVVYG